MSLRREEVVVPLVDLSRVHGEIRDGFLTDVGDLVDSGSFTNGPEVALFEEAFADYCGRRFCVGLGSGLDALRLALLAAGLQRGDEVVLPAHTFVATAEAVSQAGATPVLVDVGESDFNIDIAAAENAFTGATRAILPVHIYGQLADLKPLAVLARRYDAVIVEDACQAHGATREGLLAGAQGHAAAFSFYPTKNLGAFGDAGACVTDDPALARRVRALREHGEQGESDHAVPGYTARLDTIQALVLLRKLPLLDVWNDERRSVARFYTKTLDGVGDVRLPPVPEHSNPVWHLYVIRTARPDDLADFLRGRGIATGRHYRTPIHLTGAFEHLGYRRGAFPVAEALAEEGLSLPIFPGITERQLELVVAAISDYFTRARRS